MSGFRRKEYITAIGSEWNAHNPVIDYGEVVVATDTGLLKVGDGVTRYNLLNGMSSANALDNLLVVKSVNDLPDPVGDESILPASTVLVLGAMDLGSDALRISTGTLLRGLGGDSVMSSNTNGVIRATNIGGPVVMRELSVIATGGPCLALTGTTDHQLNLFFMALLGASVGTVSGFDVQAFKDTYFNTTDGIVNTGTTNKVFYSQCPFYGITAGNAAITLDSALVADRIDMVNNFFKHAATGIPLKAEVGYSVGYGRVTGSMLDGPTTFLNGLSETDDNWWFYENDLVPNSRAAAQSYLTAASITDIVTQGVYVPVGGAFTVTDLTQRFILNGTNELEYTGGEPILVTFISSFTVDPANNNRLGFYATKNGVGLPYTQTFVETGAGAGASPRTGGTVGLINLSPGDRVGLSVANLSSTADINWLSATYAVTT